MSGTSEIGTSEIASEKKVRSIRIFGEILIPNGLSDNDWNFSDGYVYTGTQETLFLPTNIVKEHAKMKKQMVEMKKQMVEMNAELAEMKNLVNQLLYHPDSQLIKQIGEDWKNNIK